jgi:hypothetical protein
MKLSNEVLANLMIIWSKEVYVRAAISGTWYDPRTIEASLIAESFRKQLLDRLKDIPQ